MHTKYYDKVNKRLIYCGREADADFWDRHWASVDSKIITAEKNDRLTLRILNKYMPGKKGIVLECGCGLGTKVYCMDLHGYETIGIDLSHETLSVVKKEADNLRLITGDIGCLPVKSGSINACMLLGVIEHYQKGCDGIISEMHRVLKQRGHLFVTFPVINPFRKMKIYLGLYKGLRKAESKCFYQYAFNPGDIKKLFQGADFKVLEGYNIGGIKGLKDETVILKALLHDLFDYRPKHFLLKTFKYLLESTLSPFFGHMYLLVLQKQ